VQTTGPDADPSAEELEAFADETGESYTDGRSRDYYTPRWVAFLTGGKRVPFNWAACLFGVNWCLWRRQYLLGLGVFAAESVVAFVLGVLYVVARGAVDPADPRPRLLAYLGLPIVRVPLGFAASRIYLRRAISAIRAARLSTPEEPLDRIRKRGGTSGIALAAGLLANFGVVFWSLWSSLARAGAE